jgi:pyruvate/2-oxoglutarate dehydrogenase complex dihydrolipoamide acyltransferase (E2) component
LEDPVPSEGREKSMKQKQVDYQVVPYPKIKRWMAVTYRTARHKPMIHGLLWVDVTRARTRLREHKARTGEALSFTAFIIACLAKAVEEHKAVQAFRKGSRRLIVFEDVDVGIPIERDMAGIWPAIPYTVRAANRKTFREIHQEIRAAQAQDVIPAYKAFLFLPTWFFRIGWSVLWWISGRYPQLMKKYWGTVGLTAVGMFGKGAGWGIPLPGQTLMITLGGIGEKPGGVDGQIAVREYLSLTISFDHDVIDGAPAARFTGRLKELIESGYGLDCFATEPEHAVAAVRSKKI